MENTNNNRENGRIIGGLILVGVGGALLLRNLDFPIPHWIFTWPMILILVGVYTGFRHNFQNSSWIILMAIGGFFLIDRILPGMSLEPYFWPLFIIGIGILIILRPKKKYRFGDAYVKTKDFEMRGSTIHITGEENVSDDADFLRISSVFSGVKRTILSKNFKGGNISCVFGGAEVDFSQADIQGRVVLRLEEVFGGTKLIVPPNWTVVNEVDGVFHGVEDKRKFNGGVQTTDPNKVLVLSGSSVFAGIEIKSY